MPGAGRGRRARYRGSAQFTQAFRKPGRRRAGAGRGDGYRRGTVLAPAAVEAARDAGATFAVSPNTGAAVIARAIELGLVPIPGFATASEAFAAVDAGASLLKLFPAATYGPGHLRALAAVLPPIVRVLAVGGVGPADMASWRAAGAAGFGLGSELYRSGQSARETLRRARLAVAAATASGRRPPG